MKTIKSKILSDSLSKFYNSMNTGTYLLYQYPWLSRLQAHPIDFELEKFLLNKGRGILI